MTLEEFRKSRGLTQKAFGDLIGVSAFHVSRYETGRNRPTPERARRIEQATNGAIPWTSWFEDDRTDESRSEEA